MMHSWTIVLYEDNNGVVRKLQHQELIPRQDDYLTVDGQAWKIARVTWDYGHREAMLLVRKL